MANFELMNIAEKKRLAYLQAMGIQAWTQRLYPAAAEHSENIGAFDAPVSGAEALNLATVSPLAPVPLVTGLPQPAENPTPPSPAARPAAATPPCSATWEDMEARVRACTACSLHQTRTQTVFGVGNRNADWMVIGEAPGEQEDLQGEPFVGRAGLLLNEMLRAIGLKREAVFIANVLKCRPPKNRDPQADEAAACEDYLKGQLHLVKPKIILAVGRISAQNLLKTTTAIGKLRGLIHDYQGVPLVVTYHPAYLLRSPLEKRRAFEDLRLALKIYRQSL